jgi:anthranilate phosphoribosyltransferase
MFLFAPRHHAALRHAAAPRAELGTRTLFNLLGPLANPACVRRQLTGVFDPAWAVPMAQVLAALGHAQSWVVHGEGLDELTLAGPNHVVEQRGDDVRAFMLDATTLGLPQAPIAALRGGDAADNAAALLALLQNRPTASAAYRDTVLLNAAAALVVAGRTDDVSAALVLARHSLQSGAALAVLDRLRAASETDHG